MISAGISDELHWYLAAGLLPFEEFSKEQLWTDTDKW